LCHRAQNIVQGPQSVLSDCSCSLSLLLPLGPCMHKDCLRVSCLLPIVNTKTRLQQHLTWIMSASCKAYLRGSKILLQQSHTAGHSS
jgi:hypothetical protein